MARIREQREQLLVQQVRVLEWREVRSWNDAVRRVGEAFKRGTGYWTTELLAGIRGISVRTRA